MHELVAAFERLGSLADDLGIARLAREAREAAGQAARSRFNVAVLGQFKRGKSSVLNALVGQALLPTDVLPTTGVITVVSAAEDDGLQVTDTKGQVRNAPPEELPDLVTEAKNPHNEKKILKVTVPFRCPLTERGVDLVDTPGLGSVFAHSSDRTWEFLPRVDVALLVVGAEPPVTDQELELALEASRAASQVWVVVNKADLLSSEVLTRVLDFTGGVLREKLPVPFSGPWPVSAKRALEEGYDPGIYRLRQALEKLAQEQGAAVARASASRTLKVLASQALAHCSLQLQALVAPLEDLEKKIALFRENVRAVDDWALATIARSRNAFRLDLEKLGVIRKAEEQRMEQAVRRACLRLALQPTCADKALDRLLKEHLPAQVNASLERLAEAHWRELQNAYAAYTQELGLAFDRLLQPICDAAKELFDVKIEGVSLPNLPTPKPLPPPEPAAVTLLLDWAWVRGLAFTVLPRRWRAALAVRRGHQLAREWWRRGCGDLQLRFAQAVEDIVRQAQAAIEEKLQQLKEEILLTLERASHARALGEEQVAAEVDRLRRIESELANLLAAVPEPQERLDPYPPDLSSASPAGNG